MWYKEKASILIYLISKGFIMIHYLIFKVYGNNIEIQAFAEMYNRPIHIYSYSTGKFALAF